MRSYAQSPQANSPNGMASTPGPNPPGAHETTTTSDDSDDSTPHTTLVRKLIFNLGNVYAKVNFFHLTHLYF